MQHQFDLKELEMEKRFLGREVKQTMQGAEQNLRQKTQAAQAQVQAAARKPAKV